ncbi:MAG: sensor histidine kinase [Prochloraceae cyanobacterium]|nr:sensor histidine kinase [Prochloraceae cyanobacterium]
MARSSIDPISQTIPSIGKTLRYVEWALLLATVLIVFLNQKLHGTTFTLVREYYVLYVCLSFCALLSFFFPIERPLWQRRAFIFLEILCLIPTRMLTGWNLDLLLYLFLAKSCFLLRRKDVIFTAIAAGVAWQIVGVWSIPQILERRLSNIDDYINYLSDTPRNIIGIIFSNTASYLAISIFVILLCFVLLAEQKSRQKAVALTKEVESLATALERTRIAREIHDCLGHTLTSLDVHLELSQRLHDRDPDKAKKALDTAKNLASQSLNEVRRSVATMRDSNFDLNSALVTLIEKYQQNRLFEVKCQLNLPQLPLQTSHQLYCILQEALTNIQKHSGANNVTIRSQTKRSEIFLEVVDDGIGFDILNSNSGFGLRGMKERIQILGGQIQIDSSIGEGTRIKVNIPR